VAQVAVCSEIYTNECADRFI